MLTIGQFLKKERLSQKISLEALERKTKIKSEFLEAIENESWSFLPEYPVVLGFVKSIAKTLKLDEAKAVALLRRDYPPAVVSLNPQPPLLKKFVWSPKLTFLTVSVLAILIISAYLIYQYFNFRRPPLLILYSPQEEQTVMADKVLVTGKTDSDAVILVDNQPVVVEEDGSFKTEVEVGKEPHSLEVVAKSRSGKETRLVRNLKVESEK